MGGVKVFFTKIWKKYFCYDDWNLGTSGDRHVEFVDLEHCDLATDWKNGIRFSAETGILSFRHRLEASSGAHLFSYPLGTGRSFPDGKWPRPETDQSPPLTAQDKSAWSYTSTSPYVFMAWFLIKHRIRLHDLGLHG
jgi:hypothetical protein